MIAQRLWAMVLSILAWGAVAGVSSPALAQWHDRDIHHFHEHDFDHWRGGHWIHGPHLGRAGWWWVVGGTWYFYPAPTYPYPDPYVPPAVVAAPPAGVPAAPPVAAVPQSSPAAPPPAAQYYFCDRPRGYYPYVPACRIPWRVVLAAPP